MGRRDKNKKKVSGSVKTALKTEKKLNAKHKKELTALGEDDIEKIVAQIEREEAKRQHVVEKMVAPPSRRANFTLTPHPFKDELVMLGGEFHDGRTTVVYGDMFTYNINKNEWTIVKAPGAPPPRCGHQAIATPVNKGELWVFGGEFSSPSESQFHHYKDLWVYRFAEKKWEKMLSPGGPSARSGHRMVHVKKQLIVFGGFHNNLRDHKCYNDVHMFNLETYVWQKIEMSGVPPHPRSGCILLATPDNKVLVYGGYSTERIKKDVDKGHIHTDMHLMTPEKNDQTGLKWKWVSVKQSGFKMSQRCAASAVLVQPNMAYLFGGVFDEEDDDEELQSMFFNDLVALDLEKFQWHLVTLHGKKDEVARRRRRKPKEDGQEDTGEKEENSDDEMEESSVPVESKVVDDDGVFTVTIGLASTSVTDKQESTCKYTFVPSPRVNPGLAVKHNVLYLYGGMTESGDRQYTFNDFYSLDCRKLDEWRTILKDDLSLQTWYSSSESSDSSDSSDSGESGDSGKSSSSSVSND